MSSKPWSQNINWPSAIVLIAYPLLILAMLVWYGINYSIGWVEITCLLLGHYITTISVGLGFHRLWSHGAYKTHRWIEFILMLLTAGTLQGPVLAWASDHYKHHAFTDKEGDPHSPKKYKSKLMGFLWSHMGWMLTGEGSYKHIDRVTMTKLGRKKMLVWQLKYYWQVAAFMNIVPPMLLGFVLGGTLQSAIAGFIFVGAGRAFQQQMTFCVNSLCHFVGSRKYYKGTARDIWWMFVFLLGENWHNFHHAFARDYRNGVKWYHFDVHKWLIALMEKLGLAWDLVRTSDERIQAKVAATSDIVKVSFQERWQLIEAHAKKISVTAHAKLEQIEKSKEELRVKLQQKMFELELAASELSERAKAVLQKPEFSTDKLMKEAMKKLKELEALSQKFELGIPRLSLSY